MKKWGKRCVQIAKGQFFVMLNKKSATYLSSSTDKLGCTLLSKRDKPNRCGWLSDLWQGGMPNTAMDGCSGFSPDHHTASIIPFLDKMVNTILSRDIHRAPPLAERNSIDYIFSGYAAGRICGLIKR